MHEPPLKEGLRHLTLKDVRATEPKVGGCIRAGTTHGAMTSTSSETEQPLISAAGTFP
jgi:hypothetical protein